MPIHMDGAVAPVAACGAKVSQRNAPGAMSAMAFMVRPVRPSVACISGALSAISRPYTDVLIFSNFGPQAETFGVRFSYSHSVDRQRETQNSYKRDRPFGYDALAFESSRRKPDLRFCAKLS